MAIVLTGDLLVHPQLWEQAAADAAATGVRPLDFGPLLASQRPYLAAGTLGVCHLETPVADADGPFSGYPQFNVPPQILAAAKDVGYDACTTASNHTIDWGAEGVERTLAALDAVGLDHTGSYTSAADAEEVLILDQPQARVAVIQATYGLNGLVPDEPWRVDLIDAQHMIAKARTARRLGADIVIAALHAGDEYASVPNTQQVEVAHALADSGEIDVVYGHHTHSVLPVERYNGTWIAYGLGNGGDGVVARPRGQQRGPDDPGPAEQGCRRRLVRLRLRLVAVPDRRGTLPLVFARPRSAGRGLLVPGARGSGARADPARGRVARRGRGRCPPMGGLRRRSGALGPGVTHGASTRSPRRATPSSRCRRGPW
ncbi:hypothetical protein MN0502_26240 [Arthrobacter sp. MN05-02]|nr:hypothetical protein MN0502_26240 [Arthrobacter sp. MN05-02]